MLKNSMLSLLLSLLLVLRLAVSVEISGKIELKSFLKDFEAEEYRNVEVEYVHGRTAVLTIYHDGVEQEHITLSKLETKEEMHQLFVDKGFVKLSDEEIVEMKKVKTAQAEEEARIKREEQQKRREERRAAREAAAAARTDGENKVTGEERERHRRIMLDKEHLTRQMLEKQKEAVKQEL